MVATVVEPDLPDAVYVQPGPGDRPLPAAATGGVFAGGGSEVGCGPAAGPQPGLTITLRSVDQLSRVALRWRRPVPERLLIKGDAWERSYGELGWQHLRAERLLPWYWIGWDQDQDRGEAAGVDVRPAAFASWTVDVDGVTLWLDVRNGGSALRPGDREIELATVRTLTSSSDPVGLERDLVQAMATPITAPRWAPLVGANNWYYAYGEGFDSAAVLGDARTITELADGHPVRPFSVIDDGWNPGGPGSGGPWDGGVPGVFDDMSELAGRISDLGARPGLWFRPLRSREPADRALATPRPDHDQDVTLDPTRGEVRERVAADLARFRDWGYELIKHDFSTFDVFGRFGPAMGFELTDPGWSFADRSRTNAEVIIDFYDLLRAAAGDAVLLGCNTVGHLAAGTVDAQRTGDDTSGREWERTRRMGVNTLAHRLPQHRRFFTVDADCVPCTTRTPWELNRQYLDLVARSGTALFVSVDPAARTEQRDAELAAALRIALDGTADPAEVEPLDALASTTPSRWRFGAERGHYQWADGWGGSPWLH